MDGPENVGVTAMRSNGGLGILITTGVNLEEYLQLADVFAQIAPDLTDEAMRSLNLKVDMEGQEPADVAFGWMKDKGVITDAPLNGSGASACGRMDQKQLRRRTRNDLHRR